MSRVHEMGGGRREEAACVPEATTRGEVLVVDGVTAVVSSSVAVDVV